MAQKKYASTAAITRLWEKIKALINTRISSLKFKIGYDSDTTDGGAIVGEAITTEPNYTPTGSVILTKEPVSVMSGASLDYEYNSNTGSLIINGIIPTTVSIQSVSAAQFVGNGVTLKVEIDEE